MPLRVLVVDDHLDTADSLAVLLRHMGYEANFAMSGRAAMDLARDYPPDIVIVDLRLPDFDGCDLARRMRTMRGLGSARFIAITGLERDDDHARARQAGCTELLLKPVEYKRLQAALAAA